MGSRSLLTSKCNQYVCGLGHLRPLNLDNHLAVSSTSLYLTLSRSYTVRLAEVGRLETKQPDIHCYSPGQPFLHQVFGYRGVILFPWLARVHDIDLRKRCPDDGSSKTKTTSSKSTLTKSQSNDQNVSQLRYEPSPLDIADDLDPSSEPDTPGVNSNGARRHFERYYKSPDSTIPASRMNMNSTKLHPYYQVLIDIRDCSSVSHRTQTEAVTFLGHPDNSKSVYSIKGLDYVAHDDIIPYTSHESVPIHHDLHRKLFKLNQDQCNSASKFVETNLLDNWKSKHPWLELSRVYKETTENIRVTVIPFYLGHTMIEGISFHWWRYCVRLENLGEASVQLRERHWKIFSQTNMLQTIKGRGVVGVEPILTRNEPAYQYSSHVNLQDRSGHMWGTFKLQREDGQTFECKIPPFSLESSVDATTPPASKHR